MIYAIEDLRSGECFAFTAPGEELRSVTSKYPYRLFRKIQRGFAEREENIAVHENVMKIVLGEDFEGSSVDVAKRFRAYLREMIEKYKVLDDLDDILSGAITNL